MSALQNEIVSVDYNRTARGLSFEIWKNTGKSVGFPDWDNNAAAAMARFRSIGLSINIEVNSIVFYICSTYCDSFKTYIHVIFTATRTRQAK